MKSLLFGVWVVGAALSIVAACHHLMAHGDYLVFFLYDVAAIAAVMRAREVHVGDAR